MNKEELFSRMEVVRDHPKWFVHKYGMAELRLLESELRKQMYIEAEYLKNNYSEELERDRIDIDRWLAEQDYFNA